MSGTRSIIGTIFKNFIQSFRPRQIRGNYTGKDYFGNKYYEIPAEPQIGRRRASRWFEPLQKEAYDQEIPAEWEAWLRGRRDAPPTEEELTKNLALMQLKKKNAQRIAEEQTSAKPQDRTEQLERGKREYPTYSEFEKIPGEKSGKI